MNDDEKNLCIYYCIYYNIGDKMCTTVDNSSNNSVGGNCHPARQAVG